MHVCECSVCVHSAVYMCKSVCIVCKHMCKCVYGISVAWYVYVCRCTSPCENLEETVNTYRLSFFQPKCDPEIESGQQACMANSFTADYKAGLCADSAQCPPGHISGLAFRFLQPW